jgi:carbonic anhydrase/acetyltransferase-like protein (isoleucine patch superfamily)
MGEAMWSHQEASMLERARLLRRMGVRVGEHTGIGHIRIYGRPDQVEIGANCQLQHDVRLITDGWVAAMEPPATASRGTSIAIRDNCALLQGTWVMPGVTIGPNVLVVSGSVVWRDLPPGYVVFGDPARPLLSLDMWAARVEAERARDSQSFRADETGHGVHVGVALMIASFLETIREQRSRRGRDIGGLPQPEEIRALARRVAASQRT